MKFHIGIFDDYWLCPCSCNSVEMCFDMWEIGGDCKNSQSGTLQGQGCLTWRLDHLVFCQSSQPGFVLNKWVTLKYIHTREPSINFGYPSGKAKERSSTQRQATHKSRTQRDAESIDRNGATSPLQTMVLECRQNVFRSA